MRSTTSRSGTATSREIHIGSSTRTTLFVDEPPLKAELSGCRSQSRWICDACSHRWPRLPWPRCAARLQARSSAATTVAAIDQHPYQVALVRAGLPRRRRRAVLRRLGPRPVAHHHRRALRLRQPGEPERPADDPAEHRRPRRHREPGQRGPARPARACGADLLRLGVRPSDLQHDAALLTLAAPPAAAGEGPAARAGQRTRAGPPPRRGCAASSPAGAAPTPSTGRSPRCAAFRSRPSSDTTCDADYAERHPADPVRRHGPDLRGRHHQRRQGRLPGRQRRVRWCKANGASSTATTSWSGIVSSGEGCGRRDFPGVYTEVAAPSIRAFLTLADPPAAPTNRRRPRSPARRRSASSVTCSPGGMDGRAHASPTSSSARRAAGDVGAAASGARSRPTSSTAQDAGSALRCVVKAVNPGGASVASSAPSAVVPGPAAAVAPPTQNNVAARRTATRPSPA